MKNQRCRKRNKNDRRGWATRVVIAVALALFLWVYINGSSINLISRDIENIPVTITNEESLTAKGLVLEDQESYYVTCTAAQIQYFMNRFILGKRAENF